MAELQTPAAAAIFDANADVTEKKKPEKPDEAAYNEALKKARKEHEDAKKQLADAKAKTDAASSNKDSPLSQRRQELINELQAIRKEQAGGKSDRTKVFDQINRLDEQLKSRIAEQKLAQSKANFKDVSQIDDRIADLEKQVDAGNMKIVDEKKALAEVTNLRKQRKLFSGFADSQKGIDDVKAKIKALKDTLNDPASKALADKYEKLQAELDTIKAQQAEGSKNFNALRDDKQKAYKLMDDKWHAMQKLRDDYYKNKKAFEQYEYEARQRARERQKNEREAFEREKKKERAEKMLAEARDPAYLDEIRRGESLLRYFDPSTKSAATPLLAPSGLTAAAQRTVDDTGIKGTRLVKKEDEDYFAGTGGKKGKKGRKIAGSPAPAAANARFNCPPSVMEDCGAMGIEPPYSADDVPGVVEKVKAKITFWKADQSAQTEKNIAKAQKEIERLEAEESGSAAPKTNGASSNGIVAAAQSVLSSAVDTVQDTVAEVTEGVKSMAAGENKQ